MALVTSDATSGMWTPRSAAEYTSLLAGRGIGNPILLWMPGDPASGNVPDLIGTFTGLSSAGGGVHYQSPVTGWAAKCILLDDGAVAKVVNQDAGLPDISATSALVFAWVGYTGTPGTERSAITLGSAYGTQTAHDIWASSPPKMALAWGGGGSGANTSLTVANANGVHPIVLQHNRSATLQVFQTEAETKTHAISTETGKSLALGGDNVSWWFAGGVQYILVALWSGASAELDAAHRATLIDAHVNGPAVTSIAVTPTPVALAPLATQQLAATATRADASTYVCTDGTNIPSTATATWSSDNPAAATVSATGLVTAVAAGVANITRAITSLGAATATSNASVVTVSGGGAPVPANTPGVVSSLAIGNAPVIGFVK